MGFKVYIEKSLNEYIKDFPINSYGILIGQTNKQSSYIIYLAKTPQETLDTNYLWQHAKQALYMLPGGLDILGVFYYGENADITQYTEVLQKLNRYLNNANFLSYEYSKVNLFLFISSLSHAHEVYQLDKSSQKINVVDHVNGYTVNWLQLNTIIKLEWWELSKYISESAMSTVKSSLRTQLKQGISPYTNLFDENICKNGQFDFIINNKIIDDYDKDASYDSPLINFQTNEAEGNTMPFEIDCYRKLPFEVVLNEKMPQQLQKDTENLLFTMNGSMSARAYVTPDSTVETAIKAILSDIIRTLSARCEIIIDEEETYEHETESRTFFEAPSRVFAPLSKTGLTICDYIFRGEESSECLEPFKELLDLNIEPDQIESDVENFSDPSEVSVTPITSSMSVLNGANPSTSSTSFYTRDKKLNYLFKNISLSTAMKVIVPFTVLLLAYLYNKFFNYNE